MVQLLRGQHGTLDENTELQQVFVSRFAEDDDMFHRLLAVLVHPGVQGSEINLVDTLVVFN